MCTRPAANLMNIHRGAVWIQKKTPKYWIIFVIFLKKDNVWIIPSGGEWNSTSETCDSFNTENFQQGTRGGGGILPSTDIQTAHVSSPANDGHCAADPLPLFPIAHFNWNENDWQKSQKCHLGFLADLTKHIEKRFSMFDIWLDGPQRCVPQKAKRDRITHLQCISQTADWGQADGYCGLLSPTVLPPPPQVTGGAFGNLSQYSGLLIHTCWRLKILYMIYVVYVLSKKLIYGILYDLRTFTWHVLIKKICKIFF